jgi:predicted transcriptional regulator of viral defense system
MSGVRIRLKPAQEKVIAALSQGDQQEITRAEYESIGEVSRSQAAYDLTDLVKAGLLQRVGSGRSTRYQLTHRGSGRRRWTDERIRAAILAALQAAKRRSSSPDAPATNGDTARTSPVKRPSKTALPPCRS